MVCIDDGHKGVLLCLDDTSRVFYGVYITTV